MSRIGHLIAPGLGLALLAGCASKNLVVVIPDSADGHIGAVVVEAGGEKTILNTAYAATAGAKPTKSSAEQVGQIFGTALAAQPTAPKVFTLYFINDSDQLTPESHSAFGEVFLEAKRRKAAEVVVTGHTDTMGEGTYNDTLSLQRANAVAKLFIKGGLPTDAVTTAGRGERELLVKTGDNVSEPKNRRVEITVR